MIEKVGDKLDPSMSVSYTHLDVYKRQDWVFNYGMFSCNTPRFIYRFVKGETDYELGVTRYPCLLYTSQLKWIVSKSFQ